MDDPNEADHGPEMSVNVPLKGVAHACGVVER